MRSIAEVEISLSGKHIGDPIKAIISGCIYFDGFGGSYFEPPEPPDTDFEDIHAVDSDGLAVGSSITELELICTNNEYGILQDVYCEDIHQAISDAIEERDAGEPWNV